MLKAAIMVNAVMLNVMAPCMTAIAFYTLLSKLVTIASAPH
jgi:hypothetical protein